MLKEDLNKFLIHYNTIQTENTVDWKKNLKS